MLPASEEVGQTNRSLINVSWKSNGSVIASFVNDVPNITEGFSWNTSGFVNGDFSLIILRARLSLQGMYECRVTYNSTILPSSNVTFSILGMSLTSG